MTKIPDAPPIPSPTGGRARARGDTQAQPSLLRAGLGIRLLLAGGLTGCLWLAVFWAVH